MKIRSWTLRKYSHKKKNSLAAATTIVDFELTSVVDIEKPHGPDFSATTYVNMAEEYMISVEDLKIFSLN